MPEQSNSVPDNPVLDTDLSEGFKKALDIYILRPQVVNRRCGGAVIVFERDVERNYANWSSLVDKVCLAVEDKDAAQARAQLQPSERLLSIVNELSQASLTDVTLYVRKLVSKQSTVLFPHEIIISCKGSCHFIPVEDSKSLLFPVGVIYSIKLDTDKSSLVLDTRVEPQLSRTTISRQWLTTVLKPTLAKWAKPSSVISDSGGSKSMKLAKVDDYFSKYTAMKDKYGKAITEKWPECTDPLKFVYEDIAIACYLICLWEEEREKQCLSKKQSFVDLGCGNGLLVYILSDQGYPGYGIDLRKRKVWDLFTGVADLREEAIVPSESGLFPEADWLIGNHSDELTPWIPVLAARSSRRCQFFVLPCCTYDFYGKYQRVNASKSIYSEYLGYVNHVSQSCGFNCKRDSLRIPSTRKECIIGYRNPDHTDSDYVFIDTEVAEMIEQGHTTPGGTPMDGVEEQCHSIQSAGDMEVTVHRQFNPRSRVEHITNCATVEHSVQETIIRIATDRLLRTSNYKDISTEGGGERRWNAGGTVALSELAQLVREYLVKLKSECGGLKTLMKNHHHIFTVSSADVRFKDFTTDDKERTTLATSKLKTKICWFDTAHPDGCPLSTPQCKYAHGSEDLRLHSQ